MEDEVPGIVSFERKAGKKRERPKGGFGLRAPKTKDGRKRRDLTIEFDPVDRFKFLTGFRKRKAERKRQGQEEVQRLEKEAKKDRQRERKKALDEAYDDQEKELGFSIRDIPAGRLEDREKIGSTTSKSKISVVKDDAFTKKAFGHSMVYVETTEGLDALDEDDILVSNSRGLARAEAKVSKDHSEATKKKGAKRQGKKTSKRK